MWYGKKVALRDKTLNDARDDFNWQSDPELARFDAAPVLKMDFYSFLSDYTDELKMAFDSLVRRSFGIDTLDGGKHIGNIGYYGIDTVRGDAELGIMIGNRDYWGKGYGSDAVNTLIDYIARNTALKRIYLKTLEWNIRAQKSFAKCGFKSYGTLERDGYHFILMETKIKRGPRESTVNKNRQVI